METNFGASAPYTVGVEEELQLVDPASFALIPAIDAVLAAREATGLPEGSVASELSASCVEVRSPAYRTVAELASEFPLLRRRVRDLVEGCGARLAAAGAHPFSEATEQEMRGHVVGSAVAADPTGATAVPGVWVAGNVSDMSAQVVVSAAAGMWAGALINAELVMEDARLAVAAQRSVAA